MYPVVLLSGKVVLAVGSGAFPTDRLRPIARIPSSKVAARTQHN